MAIIETFNLSHVYMRDTPFETCAIRDVTISIEAGDVVSLVGHTGCGKSTLIQHFNGLLRPTSGKVIVDSLDTSLKKTDLRMLRRKVGLVFQYPEHQLFEETVYDDIAFGPKNLAFSPAQVDEAVREAMDFLDLSFEKFRNRSPFSLSGGEMRRVALAGVLAMKPSVLILDEPTAGLDPMGKRKLLKKIRELRESRNTTILLVSHAIEEVAEISSRVIIMKEGGVLRAGTLENIFKNSGELRQAGILLPQYTQLMIRLREMGIEARDDVYTLPQAVEELLRINRKARR